MIAMANFTKFKAEQIRNLDMHTSRKADDGHNHSNENIDISKTHLNYNLAHEQKLNANDFIQERLSKIKVDKRCKTTAVGVIVTLPKDFEGNQQDFFKATYDFLQKRYGKDNVISAWVHVDEKQPHLHYLTVPVQHQIKKYKDGTVKEFDKLCGKDLETRQTLKEFHGKLKDHLETVLKCPCNVLNGATANGNKTINQLKAETLQVQINAYMEQINELQSNIEELQDKLDEFIKQAPQKKLLESNKSFDERTELYKIAVAVKQREVAVKDPERIIKEQAEELAKQMTINKANELIRQLTIERDEAYKAVKQAQLEAENKHKNKIDELSKTNSEIHTANKNMVILIEELYCKYTGETLPAKEIYDNFKNEQKKAIKNKGKGR
jgi:hypothetical protein